MQVERLRLLGFKSFVDGAELPIEPGLTGIVGPNGCGKSNLAEALRWVMGETSARRLRGGAMDDVIFAGATGRPARNIAEVALGLDNSARDAPLAFNDRDQIEILRRIERGGGSTYRINGREVRARDVQLLFADAASGAGSGALISQGRIGTLIEAKPAERRLLLEDAAGTAGLQARRRETEQRLEAAAANLLRLDDVIATIEAQFETLKKQARQAQRYRRLGEHIRWTEALLFDARRLAAEAEAERCAADLGMAERAVAELSERALSERRRRETTEEALPSLRLAETGAAAELQRLTQTRDGLEQELRHVLVARAEAERRLVQLAADLGREDELLADAAAALTTLSQERRALDQAEARDGLAPDTAGPARQAAATGLAAAEAALQRATEAAAALDARRTSLAQQRRDLDQRRARLRARQAEVERERTMLGAAFVPAEATAAVVEALATAELRVEQCRTEVEGGEPQIATRRAEEAAALDDLRRVESELVRLGAEADALQALLLPPDADGGESVLSAMRVADGFEAAIGALFEDELLAPLAEHAGSAATSFWVDLLAIGRPAPLPTGARPFAEAVTAPSALNRSLAFTGWVDGAEAGRELQPHLMPGQRLVDRDGRLWRWDGFTRMAPAPSPAAQQLRHKNRLAEIDPEIVRLEMEGRAREAKVAGARALREEAAEADRLARLRLREAEKALACAREEEAALARRRLTTETRFAAIADALERLMAELSRARRARRPDGTDSRSTARDGGSAGGAGRGAEFGRRRPAARSGGACGFRAARPRRRRAPAAPDGDRCRRTRLAPTQ